MSAGTMRRLVAFVFIASLGPLVVDAAAADDGIFNFGTHAFFGSDAPAPYSVTGIVGIG